jgi:hypothetical protein
MEEDRALDKNVESLNALSSILKIIVRLALNFEAVTLSLRLEKLSATFRSFSLPKRNPRLDRLGATKGIVDNRMPYVSISNSPPSPALNPWPSPNRPLPTILILITVRYVPHCFTCSESPTSAYSDSHHRPLTV